MNAAFLLVTSALLVGQGKGEPVPPPAAGKPAPAVASSCGSDCGGCCDGFGHRLRDRLGGLFNRGCNDACKPRCFDGHRLASFRNTCGQCCKPKIWTWNRNCGTQTCAPATCAPTTCNDPCNRRGLQLLDRLHHCFHRRDACCDGGCGTAGVVAPPVKAGEKIEAPKKMPVEAPKTPRPNDVNINNAPSTIAPSVITPQAPAAPSVEIQPPPAVQPVAPTTTIPPITPPARDPNESSRAPF